MHRERRCAAPARRTSEDVPGEYGERAQRSWSGCSGARMPGDLRDAALEGEWMDKVRVRDLAKEVGMETSKEVLAFLERIGVKGKSASSNLEGEMIDRVRAHYRKPVPPPPPPRTDRQRV